MTYEIRAMAFGEILDTGFRLLRDHVGLLLGIGLAGTLPLNVGLWAIGNDPATAQLASGVAFLLLALVAMPIVGAATIHALAELYVGRSTSVGAALRAALAIVLPLLGTQLLASLAMLAGFVLLIVPGIYLVFAFMLLVPVVVVERVYAGRAMGRSRELMRGNFLRGFGLMIVVGLLYSVVAVALGLFALASPLGGAIAQSVAQAIYAAFQSAVMLVFYFDARCRKEAFDLDHLAGVVEARVA